MWQDLETVNPYRGKLPYIWYFLSHLTSLLVLYDQRRSTTGAGSRLLDAVVVQLRVKLGEGPGQNGVSSGRRRHGGRVDGELRGKEELIADVRNMTTAPLSRSGGCVNFFPSTTEDSCNL